MEELNLLSYNWLDNGAQKLSSDFLLVSYCKSKLFRKFKLNALFDTGKKLKFIFAFFIQIFTFTVFKKNIPAKLGLTSHCHPHLPPPYSFYFWIKLKILISWYNLFLWCHLEKLFSEHIFEMLRWFLWFDYIEV